MGVSLIYIPSCAIVEYVAANPVNWLDHYRYMAKRGGIGDTAGITPTPAVYEFLSLYHHKKGLFTQREYAEWCFEQWHEWLTEKTDEQRRGVGVKLYRNFYPSMIDSLHVWAMMVETGGFHACILDSTLDAVGKTDLTLVRDSMTYRVALLIDSANGVGDRRYKLAYRSTDSDTACIEIRLPLSRDKTPGNKRWYYPADVIDAMATLPLLEGR